MNYKEAIAVPIKIIFTKNPLIIISGKPVKQEKKEWYEDKQAEIVQYQYGDEVEFIQPFSLKGKVKINLTGTITYQACTNEERLTAKTISFSVQIL